MSKIVSFYATDVDESFFQIKGAGTLFVLFDGMSLQEEEAFIEKCNLHGYTVVKTQSFFKTPRQMAILETGGFMDGFTCRPLQYSK